MSTPLKFELSLTQTFAKALAPVVAGLGKTQAEMESVRVEAKILDDQFAKTRARLLALKTNPEGLRQLAAAQRELRDAQRSLTDEGSSLRGFFTFDIASAAASALGVVRDLARGFVDLGIKIAHTVGRQQDLDLALNLTVGGQSARALSALAKSFERTTGFDNKLVEQEMLPLLDAGVTSPKMLDNIATAAADVAARQGTGAAGFQAVMGSFSKMAITRIVDQDSLKAIGVNQTSFYKNLGNLLHVSGNEARQEILAGLVERDVFMTVALEEIAKREGGALGKAALAGARTFGGTLRNLENLAGNLFERIADGPGMKKVQASLDSFIAKMNGPIGDKLMSRVDVMLGKFAEFLNPETIGRWLDRLVGAFDRIGSKLDGIVTVCEAIATVWVGSKIVGAVTAFAGLLPGIATGVGAVTAAVGGLGVALGAVTGGLAAVGFAAVRINSTAKEFGGWHAVFNDFRDWIHGDQPALAHPLRAAQSVGQSVGDGFKGGVQSSLDIHSPSREMARLGAMAMAGFAVGLDGGADGVRSSSRDALSKMVLGEGNDAVAGIGSGRGRSAGITFAPTINFHGVEGDEHKIADEAARQIRVEFVRLLDDIGLMSGAAA